MKSRYRFLFTVFSLILLAFALYLNFLKKDAPEASAPDPYVKAASGALNKKEPPKTPPAKKDKGAVVASK